MKKKIYKRNFIALAVVALLLLVFTVVGFNIPFTTNTFKGFAKSINTGLDFGGGTTDFDFGVWRGASDDEYDKYNYYLIHSEKLHHKILKPTPHLTFELEENSDIGEYIHYYFLCICTLL